MFNINLGVMDIPYTDENGEIKVYRMKKKTGLPYIALPYTTGKIAGYLENKYGIMSFFIENYGQDIAEEAVKTWLDKISGLSRNTAEFMVLNKTEHLFKTMIDLKEMDHKHPFVPTKVSLKGKSLRFKRRRGPPRPSFIDSGLYQANFKAWIDQ